MDVEKQIAYWREGARLASRSVPVLEEGGFWLEALFWTHLCVEKSLKAHVAKTTRDIPPYTHNLVRLAEAASLDLSPGQLQLCEDLSIYQRIARYPDDAVGEPDGALSQRLLRDAKEFQEWLLKKL